MTQPEFWIDVGGTFTDCIGRGPDGRLLRHKLLSSGVTKGAIGRGSTRTTILDAARRRDPPRFWNGYRIWLLGDGGERLGETRVLRFDHKHGALHLDFPLGVEPQAERGYELASDEEAPIAAVRYLLGLPLEESLPPVTLRLGTTRGTNALLTRRGARTALLTTRGFADALRIGYQNRPELFELAIRLPESLFSEVVEIDQRTGPDGASIRRLDAEAVSRQLQHLRDRRIESLAVCLLHAYCQAEDELHIERIARRLGFEEISLSSRVAPLVKLVARGDTTVVDAYLNPVLRAYVDSLRRAIPGGRVQILTSAGGLVEADHFVGKDSILSGPAGGVVGFSSVAQAAGFQKAIGFDMGGTSTDVSRFDGRFRMQYETEKAGVRVVAPMMAIETVAAGGGSICQFDGVKLAVGPDSAGAHPGPACYGRGGPLAVTDMNFYLGKIPADRFPFPLDRAAVASRLAALCDEIDQATNTRYSPAELAEGFLRVANTNMAGAIRTVSIAEGCDPREYVMVAFGGAAGQHACAVAEELGIRRVLSHPDAGILSAYGIGTANVVRHRARGIYRPYSDGTVAEIESTFEEMEGAARGEVLAEGIAEAEIETRRLLDLRYRGLDAYLTIPEPTEKTFAEAYGEEHHRLYGYASPKRPLEIVAARVEVVGRRAARLEESFPPRDGPLRSERTSDVWLDGRWQSTPVFDRQCLRPGDRIAGPAVVAESQATTVVDAGWQAAVLTCGELLIERVDVEQHCETRGDTARSVAGVSSDGAANGHESRHVSTEVDPIILEVFNNQFSGIARQMGVTLRNTSSSVNVKERLDFSCAIFTCEGELVVNAPHIPVHLGAMGQTVRSVLQRYPRPLPGDVFITNDPYCGGAHLPDITVVTPVHDCASGRLIFFTASRAHHAEIGGISPGSMPPFSRNLAEEGALIPIMKLFDAGQPRTEAVAELLSRAQFPSRAVADNLADINAQTAANRQGICDLLSLVDHFGLPVVEAYMRHIQDAAEQKMRLALRRLPDKRYRFTDHMDDGSPIAVEIAVAGDEAIFDFTGSSAVVPGNLNANPAIVTAAVMYCLRSMIDEDIPLNEGVLAPVRIVLPEGMLSPPRRDDPWRCAAVVGGNVETSQRVVDVVLGALGLAAASQGTMNNLIFGDDTFGYYETICGGAGATPNASGAHAVHTHMTNTRITDPEVIEQKWPVRVLEFSIRRGAGGRGRHPGGDGAVRRLRFLSKLKVAILSQRRGRYRPFGLDGGESGMAGRNVLIRPDGSEVLLGASASFTAEPGDVLRIETPGGGGFGDASD